MAGPKFPRKIPKQKHLDGNLSDEVLAACLDILNTGAGWLGLQLDYDCKTALVCAHLFGALWARSLGCEVDLHLHSLRNYELQAAVPGHPDSCTGQQTRQGSKTCVRGDDKAPEREIAQIDCFKTRQSSDVLHICRKSLSLLLLGCDSHLARLRVLSAPAKSSSDLLDIRQETQERQQYVVYQKP